MDSSNNKRGRPAPAGRRKFGRALLLLLGLGGTVSCSNSWQNERFVYLRNQSSFDVRLTWKIPRALLQEGDARSPGAAVVAYGTMAPTLRYAAADTVLDNDGQTLTVHSRRAGGDSVLLTVGLRPGTTYLVSYHQSSFRRYALHQYEVADFTFRPCTVSWVTAEGQRQQRAIDPQEWRQAQDSEAEGKWWTNSYTLVRYVDYP